MTTQKIFSANQVLTVAKAKELKGKKIACTSPEYKYNAPHVSTFVVGEIISSWDLAQITVDERYGDDKQYKNHQEYWKSYMNEKQIDEQKTTLVLLSIDGGQYFKAHTKYFNFYNEPTFTGSDADREVYYIELEKQIIFKDPSYNNNEIAVKSESEFHSRFALNPGIEIILKGYEEEISKWIKANLNIKVTRIFHKKEGNERTFDFLTNLTVNEVIELNPWLSEPDRKIIDTKEEIISINDNKNCREYFKNGILQSEWLDKKPDPYADERAWNEMYQKTTGNTLPKGGILR